MDFTAPTKDPRANPRNRQHSPGTLANLDRSIEDLQLHRLAGAVLSKSAADMAALSEANPELFWEWIEAFSLKKRQADAECRLWSAAIACLATATTAGARHQDPVLPAAAAE